MFVANRGNQRSTGRAYPNKVTVRVDRSVREDKDYIAVHLENDFVDVWVLPEIGGRIFAAQDKSNGYDFFYRQHVIKPALIGSLGSCLTGPITTVPPASCPVTSPWKNAKTAASSAGCLSMSPLTA